MRAQSHPGRQQSFLMPTLREQLDPRQPLYQLAEKLPWTSFEEAFAGCYSTEGRPAKPVRLMVGLLLLKQLHNLGDESSGTRKPVRSTARRVAAAAASKPSWRSGCKIHIGSFSVE
jgi:IS5 family transposase